MACPQCGLDAATYTVNTTVRCVACLAPIRSAVTESGRPRRAASEPKAPVRQEPEASAPDQKEQESTSSPRRRDAATKPAAANRSDT